MLSISFCFIWLPALIFGLAILPLWFYRRYERMEERIRLDLQDRHLAEA